MRVNMGCDLVYYFQEIFDRHVRMLGRNMAVTSTMEAGRSSCILARFFRMLLNSSNARRLRNPGRLFILYLLFEVEVYFFFDGASIPAISSFIIIVGKSKVRRILFV